MRKKFVTKKYKLGSLSLKIQNCSDVEQAFNLVHVHFHGKHIIV